MRVVALAFPVAHERLDVLLHEAARHVPDEPLFVGERELDGHEGPRSSPI